MMPPNPATPATRNPIKAIRRNCLRCCGSSPQAVADCPSGDCPLWAFRMGKNPFRTSPTQKPKSPILSADTPLSDGCQRNPIATEG